MPKRKRKTKSTPSLRKTNTRNSENKINNTAPTNTDGSNLDAEIIEKKLELIDDDTFSLWKRGYQRQITYNFCEDRENIFFLDTLGLVCLPDTTENLLSEAKYRTFCFTSKMDVYEIYERDIDGERFDRKRERYSWVMKCLWWAERMYYYTPISTFLVLVNCKNNIHMSREELSCVFNDIKTVLGPDCFHLFPEKDAFVFDRSFGDKEKQLLSELLKRQGRKGFYIPPVKVIDDFYREAVLITSKPYQDMLSFLTQAMKIDQRISLALIVALWKKLSKDGMMSLDSFFDWFFNFLLISPCGRELINHLINLYFEVCKVTNMRDNRGFAPINLYGYGEKALKNPISPPTNESLLQ